MVLVVAQGLLAVAAATGAIYLANPCLVIGNFIIFLEASQSLLVGRGGGGSGDCGKEGSTNGRRAKRKKGEKRKKK